MTNALHTKLRAAFIWLCRKVLPATWGGKV